MTRIRSGAPALLFAVAALAACSAGAPPNDVAEGVGFQDYAAWEARRAHLRGEGPAPVTTVVPPFAPPAATVGPVAAAPPAPTSPAPAPAEAIAARAAAAIAAAETGAPATGSAAPALPPMPAAAPPGPPLSDAERLARMQGTRAAIAAAGGTPDLVTAALPAGPALGVPRYTRRPIPETRHQSACAGFASAEAAQDWFLQNGGPGRDRQGLDPDGDGYACGFGPGPLRTAGN